MANIKRTRILKEETQDNTEIIKENFNENVDIKVETKQKKELLSTGCTVLDCALGGGIQLGTLFNLVGDRSSGKSAIAAEMIAYNKKKYGDKFKWVYNDVESGLNLDTLSMYGFEIKPENGYYSHTIEDFAANLSREVKKVKDDEILLYVLDSFDALSSEEEIKRVKEDQKIREAAMDGEEVKEQKGTFNQAKQRSLNEFFRTRAKEVRDKNCVLLIISQVRENIGISFGPKYRRSGGPALDHSANQIMWLSECEEHYKLSGIKKRAIGITTKAKVTKNRVGKPFRFCFMEILFDYGVDDLRSNLTFLYDLKTETGKDSNKKEIDWNEEKYTLDKLIENIEDNNEEEKLRSLVIEKWDEIETSIAPNRKSKI
jgi:RecA/RadA recombinase